MAGVPIAPPPVLRSLHSQNLPSIGARSAQSRPGSQWRCTPLLPQSSAGTSLSSSHESWTIHARCSFPSHRPSTYQSSSSSGTDGTSSPIRTDAMAGGMSRGDTAADPALDLGGGGSGDNGSFGDGGHGGRGDGEGESLGDGDDGKGALLTWAAVQKILSDKGLSLPADMAEHAQREGLFSVFLDRFVQLQSTTWPLGPLIQWSAGLRNRLLADPSFLFKVLAEVAIDSGCATFAEVQKRGSDFWKEFDLYASDMLVGIVMDVALVSMLAPVARFSALAPAATAKSQSALQRFLTQLPSSMFEASVPGRHFTLVQRGSTWFVKAAEYGVVGFSCGLVGQGIANGIITLKKSLRGNSGQVHPDVEEVKTPPLLRTALLWGVFMAISSNTRYQVVNGLETIVEGSLVAKKFPLVSSGFTVAVRFGNNIFGGMQFVDWARLSGVQ